MATIDELSGADLARAVAEARGYRPDPPKPMPYQVSETTNVEGKWYYQGTRLTLWGDGTYCYGYRPHLDIYQAWELLEELASDWQVAAGRRQLMRKGSPPYWAAADELRPGGRHVRGDAENVETAICRAYLKARGWEGDD